jgi:hypothetical protein
MTGIIIGSQQAGMCHLHSGINFQALPERANGAFRVPDFQQQKAKVV